MFPLLLTLLVIALMITMTGLFLTTKPKNQEEQPEYLIPRRGSRIIHTIPPRKQQMPEGIPSRRIRSIEPIPLPGKRIVDAVPTGRRYIDNPMPIARRRVVASMPMYSSQVGAGRAIRFARYISASAVLEQLGWRRKGE